MCRSQIVEQLFRLGVDPAVEKTATWKGERMGAVVVDDGNLKLAVEWRGGDRLPFHTQIVGRRRSGALTWIRKLRFNREAC